MALVSDKTNREARLSLLVETFHGFFCFGGRGAVGMLSFQWTIFLPSREPWSMSTNKTRSQTEPIVFKCSFNVKNHSSFQCLLP